MGPTSRHLPSLLVCLALLRVSLPPPTNPGSPLRDVIARDRLRWPWADRGAAVETSNRRYGITQDMSIYPLVPNRS